MKTKNNGKELSLRLIGEMLGKGFDELGTDEQCFVKLTPELAEHVISMVENTSNEEWEEYDPYLPFETWDDKECEIWRSHIGEFIRVSIFDDPYNNIMEDSSFPNGVKIELADDMMDLAFDCICDYFFDGEGGGCSPVFWYFQELDEAITLLKKNGLSDKEISKKFHNSRKRALKSRFPYLV